MSTSVGWRKLSQVSTESVAEKNAREARERTEKDKASGITEEEKRKRREAIERSQRERKEREEREAKERKAKEEKDAAEKAAKEAAAAEADAMASVPECVQGLLVAGGFTRRLTWRERRGLRRVERAAERLRTCIEQTLGKERCEGAFARYAYDGLAHIEVACRLELLRNPAKD